MTLPALARDFVGVRGPDAASYLQAMVSNDVEALAPGDTCEALLLTPKARVIARLTVLRRAPDDFLLLTEAGRGEPVRAALLRSRFAAKCEIELEKHRSVLVVGEEPPPGAIPNRDYGVPAYELLDAGPRDDLLSAEPEYLERLRIRALTPYHGPDLDDRVLPAEAGLVERAVDFAKGCYPGQEPIARQHYRGRVNRSLRALLVEWPPSALPQPGADVVYEGKVVGRVTSSVREERPPDVLVLAYVRTEVPEDAVLEVEGYAARPLHSSGARP